MRFFFSQGHRGDARSPYGTLFNPGDYGSHGCPGHSDGGKAGGVMHISVGDELYLDGTFEVNGQSASSGSNAGGGSGGSILISTGRFNGHGTLSSNGGNGNGALSGGGSGGRLAIYTRASKNKFLGVYSVFGGQAGDNNKELTVYSGGPGTVYLEDIRNDKPYSQLRIDNQNRPWSHFVTLDENLKSYTFDEVHLFRNSSIHMIENGEYLNLTINKIVGDRTGLVHMHRKQLLKAEYKPTSFTLTR